MASSDAVVASSEEAFSSSSWCSFLAAEGLAFVGLFALEEGRLLPCLRLRSSREEELPGLGLLGLDLRDDGRLEGRLDGRLREPFLDLLLWLVLAGALSLALSGLPWAIPITMLDSGFPAAFACPMPALVHRQ